MRSDLLRWHGILGDNLGSKYKSLGLNPKVFADGNSRKKVHWRNMRGHSVLLRGKIERGLFKLLALTLGTLLTLTIAGSVVVPGAYAAGALEEPQVQQVLN